MPEPDAATEMFKATPLGRHKNKPVLRQSAVIQRANKAVTGTMMVAPFKVEPAGDIVLSIMLHQHSERYVNIMSEDDPELLMGYERVVVFDALGAVPDERPETETAVVEMLALVADKEEAEKSAKAGQFRLPKPDANVVGIR